MIVKVFGVSFQGPPLDSVLDHLSLDLDLANKSADIQQVPGCEEVFAFFDKEKANTDKQDHFYEGFAGIARELFEHEHWHRAARLLEKSSWLALEWERQNPGFFIHKGTLYYYWGMAAIMSGDLDAGYVLMHQAFREDIRTQGVQQPHTPAFAFATLEYEWGDPTFRDWSRSQAQFLERFLSLYRTRYNRPLQLSDFRARFLAGLSRLDTVFLFAYTLGRLLFLDRVPASSLQSDFAAQLELDLLLNLSLVSESAIRERGSQGNSFSLHATFLSSKSGLGLTQHQLQKEINGAFDQACDATFRSVLDGKFQLHNGNTLTGLSSDLAVAYGLRNYAAHNIMALPVISERFVEICQSLFDVLFLTVETLY